MIAQRMFCVAAAAGAILFTSLPTNSQGSLLKPVGQCYENMPLHALRAGSRVFIQLGLEEDRGRNAKGELIRVRFATGSLMVAKNLVAKNADESSGPVFVPGDIPVTIRATRLICAYDAGMKLPAIFENIKPDIVIQ